ncbi:MAG: GntR family transcriptional regulator [Planctomycetota bacterium]|jgi:DNA-binding GntR family transcriptional regulator
MGRSSFNKNADEAPAGEKAYDYLKAKIFSGRIAAGKRLVEERIAKEVGVSRTPIREALHRLELEGLIEPLEGKGFCVPYNTMETAEELFDLRSCLEGYALRLICESISEETLEELEGFTRRAEEALARKKTGEVFEWNTCFHDTLYGLLEHKSRFHNLIVNMRKYVLRYRQHTLHYLRGAEKAIEWHRKILLALKLGDPDVCEKMMRQHIQVAKQDFLQKYS